MRNKIIRVAVLVLIIFLMTGAVEWQRIAKTDVWGEFLGQYSTIAAVVALDTNNVWTAGVGGEIFHYNGKTWKKTKAGKNRLFALAEWQRRYICAVGDNGTVVIYNDSAWSKPKTITRETLMDVAVYSPSDIWVIGRRGGIYHYDGGNWSKVYQMGEEGDYRSINVLDNKNIWVAGVPGLFHYDGVSATKVVEGRFYKVNSSGSDVWAISQQVVSSTLFISTIWKYDKSWEEVFKVPDCRLFTCFVDKQNAWFGGSYGTVVHFDGMRWSVTNVKPFAIFYGLYVLENQIWAAGEGTSIQMVRQATLWHSVNNRWRKEI